MSEERLEPASHAPKPGFFKGYRRRPSGRYQVRVAGFPPEVVDDELTAMLRVAATPDT